ncbi:MAG: translation initiation factor IF-2 [Cyanobacteria bacterium J06641_5]
MSKVRIYELSKELNLDNKDILSICERLSIAVKSHSSTITESEAEQIRASAAKLQGNGQNGQAKAPVASNRRPAEAKPAPVRPKQPPIRAPQKKSQQILAVRKRAPGSQGESESQSAAVEGGDVSAPKLVAPPRIASKERSSSEPSTPERPSVVPKPKRLNNPPRRRSEAEAEPVAPHSTPSQPTASAPQAPQQPVASAAPRRAPAPAPTAPRLVGPPSRPTKPKQQVVRIERGTGAPKPTRPAISPAAVGGGVEAPKKPTLTGPPTRQSRPAAGAGSRRDEAATGNTDLDRTDGVGVEPEDSIEVIEKKPSVKLRRPVARPQPEWEDDRGGKAKTAKAATKTGKRRGKTEIEDDDLVDPEEANASGVAGGPASSPMSLARPPKPEVPGARKRPTTRPGTAARPKRQSRGQSRSESRDRRREAQEAVSQRPEKIALSEELTVQELAHRIGVAETEIVRNLFFKGIAATITQTLDLDTARTVVEEMGIEVETPEEEAAATKTEMLETEDLENLQLRPPVVTIMGHVDHGKTSLLDAIRKTKVAQGEAGGITQHIGAYHVDVEHEDDVKQVVFLDTPGHEAFTAMRARGASITDISILVVAADDGVQPQTREAIGHAKAAGVPLIVAINKIDKEGSNPDRVKQELSEEGLMPEEWGGDTVMVPVSATRGDNLDDLLENILLVSEIEELMANPDRLAKGTIIEANLDRARGPVATLLVQNGTLRVGDVLVAGSTFGKVRAMVDDRGQRVEEAKPSFAVEVLGLGSVPAASDEFEVYATEKEARAIADQRGDQQRQTRLLQASGRRVSLKALSEQAQEGELKELNIILKADVQGSIEAILGTLKQMPQGEVQIRPLLAAPGEVTETDISLASASGAVVVGFNTTLASGAREAADEESVDVRVYDVIYKLFDDIQAAMEGLLDPEEVEEPLGEAEVRAIFPVGRGAVAGCYIRSGRVVRNRNLRVRRGDQILYEGFLDSLKRMKDDVREVNTGFECGIRIDKFNNWKEGDVIEVFEMVMQRRKLAQV